MHVDNDNDNDYYDDEDDDDDDYDDENEYAISWNIYIHGYVTLQFFHINCFRVNPFTVSPVYCTRRLRVVS